MENVYNSIALIHNFMFYINFTSFCTVDVTVKLRNMLFKEMKKYNNIIMSRRN